MKNKSVILASVILVALGSIYFTTFKGMSTPNRQPYKDLGKKMADETASLLGHGGRIAIIINQEFGVYTIPSLDVEMKAFMGSLKQKGITVEAIEKVQMQKVGLARPRAFFTAIENQKDVDAVVSLVGFPMAPNQHPAAYKHYRAKFIVVAPYEPGLKSLLQEGIIQIAILPKFGSRSGNESASAPFGGGFQVFTPKDAAGLP
jgi:hypothetical protein